MDVDIFISLRSACWKGLETKTPSGNETVLILILVSKYHPPLKGTGFLGNTVDLVLRQEK